MRAQREEGGRERDEMANDFKITRQKKGKIGCGIRFQHQHI